MAKKGETRLQRKIQRALKREFNCWVMKIWGSMFQMAGVPDLLICCAGLFIGIEVKMPKGRVSEIQHEVMRDIRKKGGGFATVVTTAEEAVLFVRRVLAKEGKLLEGIKAPAETRRRVQRAKKVYRTTVQATSRKDLHRRRRRRAS